MRFLLALAFVRCPGVEEATVLLQNEDAEPMHIECSGCNGRRISSGSQRRGYVEIDTLARAGTDHVFSAHRGTEFGPISLGTVTCTSNTTDTKTVVYDGLGLYCGNSWDMVEVPDEVFE